MRFAHDWSPAPALICSVLRPDALGAVVRGSKDALFILTSSLRSWGWPDLHERPSPIASESNKKTKGIIWTNSALGRSDLQSGLLRSAVQS